jgi:hypothetical protein
LQATRREPDVRLKKPLKFDERLVVKHDVFEIFDSDPSLVQAVLDSSMRESRIMFLAGKPFFLRRCDDFAIPH